MEEMFMEMFGLGKIADAVNGFVETSKKWSETDFLTYMCMMFDEWSHHHGGNPVENAQTVATQVEIVNGELGAY